MNTKSFLLSGVVAFVLNFLLGWLFYGILFPDLMPKQGEDDIVFIALGCLFSGFLLAYIFTLVASIKGLTNGLKIGAIYGLLSGLSMNFFMYASMEPNYQNIATDVVLSIVMMAIVGAAVAMINDKMD